MNLVSRTLGQRSAADDNALKLSEPDILQKVIDNGMSQKRFKINWNKKLGTYNTVDSTFWDGSLFKGLGFAWNLQLFLQSIESRVFMSQPLCIQFGSHFILRSCEHWKREQLAPLFKNPC
jgi:hypothetical protein